MRSILDQPGPESSANFKSDFGQRFIVTVDTEEEFDWGKPLTRDEHDLKHVAELATFQRFCEEQGVIPSYLVDWPIATSKLAAEILSPAIKAGKADIGVQLHPWVNPPFDEDVCEFNSYAGNLPKHLEEAKLLGLRDEIEKNFGAAPLIYRAGRYGLGPNTAGILAKGGIAIDTSVRAKFDYSALGGPNYREHPLTPYWVDDKKTLLELPLTTNFWGVLRQAGDALYPRLWRAPIMRGLLAKARLLERIPLTPEGTGIEELTRGIDMAVDAQLPVLVFSFHSPSLQIGHTPYVRDQDDLDALYDWWRQAFAYLAQHNVKPTCVADIMENVRH